MSYKRNLLPKMAVERLQSNPKTLFVDVRSKAEYKYVGYPENSILIPWIDDPDWEPNPVAFSDSVMQELDGRENLLNTEIKRISEEIEDLNGFKFYPNPATEKIQIEWSELNIKKLDVIRLKLFSEFRISECNFKLHGLFYQNNPFSGNSLKRSYF